MLYKTLSFAIINSSLWKDLVKDVLQSVSKWMRMKVMQALQTHQTLRLAGARH